MKCYFAANERLWLVENICPTEYIHIDVTEMTIEPRIREERA